MNIKIKLNNNEVVLKKGDKNKQNTFEILKKRNAVVEISHQKSRIVGDIHGQFYDMLTIFDVRPPENEENVLVSINAVSEAESVSRIFDSSSYFSLLEL